MTKAHFIQHLIIRACPGEDKFSAALAHAEWLWAELSKAGYGDLKPATPRKSTDWYAGLGDRQKRYFDAFWNAFALKTGKNEAAERWGQLGDLSNQQYQQIIDAAGREARRELKPGQVRKYAQGWLFDKRWNDYQPTQQQAKSAGQLVLRQLQAECDGLKRLQQQTGEPVLQSQIDKLEAAIEAARGAQL